jgi:hypothetical protein
MKRLEGADSGVAPRRTGDSHSIQGLKPLATIVQSLRDFSAIGENGQTPDSSQRDESHNHNFGKQLLSRGGCLHSFDSTWCSD